MAAATLTLELGIDLGELERVLQLGAPYSCASFVQRLGRSGRRGDAASEMIFVTPEEEDEEAQLPARMPWTLLRAIAVIELYVREKWVEPLVVRQLPVGLLYHQTMSILKSMGEAEPEDLKEAVLSLPSFRSIDPADYDAFMEYMQGMGHIEKMDEGSLLIGMAGRRSSTTSVSMRYSKTMKSMLSIMAPRKSVQLLQCRLRATASPWPASCGRWKRWTTATRRSMSKDHAAR